MSLTARTARLALAAVAVFAGVTVASADSAQARARCEAVAITAFGTEVPGTHAADRDWRPARACRVAVSRCEALLDDVRHRTGRPMPFAQCQVVGRGGGHVEAPHPRFECKAEAFTRRGRPVDHTRAAEVRFDRKAACEVALDTCERRLEDQRWRIGRDLPYARCEVTSAGRI